MSGLPVIRAQSSCIIRLELQIVIMIRVGGDDNNYFCRRTAVAANGETATLQRLYFLRGNLSDLKNRVEEDVEKELPLKGQDLSVWDR